MNAWWWTRRRAVELFRIASLLMMFAMFASSAALSRPIEVGPILQCGSAEDSEPCRPIDLNRIGPAPRDVVLARSVNISADDLPLAEPLSVWLVAMGSSEVRWNGKLIGRNGMPGPDASHERPGRFIASIKVPPELVRAGSNRVTVSLSSHHLWLPVRRTIHEFDIVRYEPVVLPGLVYYLPALLMLGAFAATGLFFASARLLDRSDRAALLLAAIACLTLVQLVLETSRSFVLYLYPWHLARVGAIALLAGLNSVLVAAYAARRFAPDWQKRVVLAGTAFAIASLVAIPWYDIKALGALSAGFVLALIAALLGWKRGITAAPVGAAVAVLFFMLVAWQRTGFLDRAYYILLAAMLVLLTAERLLVLREMRRGRQAEALRAQSLESKLERLGPSATALLKDGSRTHHVAEEEISHARAADDYSEVVLRDGRILLVTTNLARLLETLSPRFVRVHKSFIVNRGLISAVEPRPGGGRQIVLADGSRIPVGRSYSGALQSIDG